MTLRIRAKVLLHLWSYNFMKRHYPLNKAMSSDKANLKPSDFEKDNRHSLA